MAQATSGCIIQDRVSLAQPSDVDDAHLWSYTPELGEKDRMLPQIKLEIKKINSRTKYKPLRGRYELDNLQYYKADKKEF